MLVVHVGNYKPDSANGVDKTIAGLIRHLPAAGIEVEVWHPTGRARKTQSRIEDGVTIYDLPVFRPLKPVCCLGGDARDFVRERAQSVDLLHLHSVFQGENLRLSRLGIPYVVTPNGGYDPLVLSGRNRLAKAVWFKLCERPFLERAKLIQAVSFPEREAMATLALRTPVRYIPNGIDDAVLQRPAAPPSQLSQFVFLGRLAIEQKGLDLLLQGYAKASAQSPDLPPLVLAGPDFRGGLRQLTALARDLGIAARIVFVGPVFGERKWELLSRARIFLHTSRWEGMPFALLEAMAIGRPALITAATNIATDLSNARAGIVVAPDTDAIAEGLRQMASLPGEALDTMGQMARSMVKSTFAWPTIAGELGREYRAAVGD